MNDDRLLLCLLNNIPNPSERDRSLIAKLSRKVAFSQLEVDFCLNGCYIRDEIVSEPNMKGGTVSHRRNVVTPKGMQHIGYLWIISPYNRKWYQKVFQFSWASLWTAVLTAFLTYLFSQLQGCQR